MRRPVVGGNWKMNLTLPQGLDLARALVRADKNPKAQVILFPAFPLLTEVGKVLAGTGLELGAQNLSAEERGAFTGEVSAEMLKSLGLPWVLVGHSERRKIYGESDKIVAAKLRRALDIGIAPLLCVGETLQERDGQKTQAVLKTQIDSALTGLYPETVADLVVAYEPVWAIGTGRTATPAQAQEAHAWIRGTVRASYGEAVASRLRIQYGGSVTKDNAAELMACPDVDGALVGGASLKADSFQAIVAAAGKRAS